MVPPPREVYIEPTNRCNELCTTCPRTFFTREPEADLDLGRFVAILDQFPGVERVVLHGVGEPLLARDLPAMVAEANHRGARVLFNTNALALHRRLAERPVAGERPWSGCTRPWRSTYVTANGNVLPCCFAPFTTKDYAGVILGNVHERPMSEIWNGSEYEAFRRAHASDDPPECCRGCGTRWMY